MQRLVNINFTLGVCSEPFVMQPTAKIRELAQASACAATSGKLVLVMYLRELVYRAICMLLGTSRRLRQLSGGDGNYEIQSATNIIHRASYFLDRPTAILTNPQIF